MTGARGTETSDRIIRASIAVGIAHLLFKVAGFAQALVVGRYLDDATFDVVYAFAFEGVIFSLFLIGEEVIGPAFLPVFMQEKDADREDSAWSFANTLLTVQTMILLLVVLVLVSRPEWAVRLLTAWHPDDAEHFALGARSVALVAPALICFSLGSTTYMLLNGHKKFFLAAFGDASWKICVLIAAAVGMGAMGLGHEAILFGLLAGSVAKLGTHLVGLRAHLRRFRPRLDLRSKAMRTMLALMLPLILGIVFAKVRDLYNSVTVLSAIGQDGLMKANLFGRKLYVAIGWLIPYALSIAMFPFFCELVDRDDREQFARVLTRACRALLCLFVPLAFVCVALAEPISMFLFLGGEFDVQTVLWSAVSMACYTLVLPAAAVEYLLMQAFFAQRRMVAVTVVGIGFSSLSIAISWTAIRAFGATGAAALAAVALGFTLSRTLKSGTLVALLRRNAPVLPPRTTFPFLFKCILVALASGLAAYVASQACAALFPFRWDRIALLPQLAAGGLAAAAAFLLTVRLLHLEEPAEMLAWGLAKVRGRRGSESKADG